ncbi:hypothetical protein CEP51_003295 [Fusarium floridanum]|uniref:Tryptophan synthase beta chain-like PALP domain-containing protein n=1 Tax=Fusarium floridanum TaxID=1325733 RepID=A0A428S760_9HYPO|nr:hypothetical protein CEP51_003295 [Fusarium floridanum]
MESGAFRADQFTRDGNWMAHHDGTGAELWQQTDGHIDGFVNFVGSGGTYAGVTKKLESLKPSVKCFIVEPVGAAVLAKEQVTQAEHPIQGGGYVMPDLGRGPSLGDIFGGFSSGANISAAIELLKGEMAGKTIAIMICDSGLKYLSTDLWLES